MFIQVHDLNDGLRTLINVGNISRIEERTAGCMVYLTTTSDDFDRTSHQVMIPVQEDYSYFIGKLNIF